MNALADAWLTSPLAQFHFLRPLWLLAIIPAALLLWAIRRRGDMRHRWRDAIAPHLLAALMIGERSRRAVRPVHLTALLLTLGAIALAGPSWEREQPPFLDDKAPLAIAIDLSQTMDAIDVSPTRLERAKLKVKALLDRRVGARTAIYAYAGSTHLVLPLTDDAQLVRTFVDSLETRIMPVPGKNTALALRTADAMLAREKVPGTLLFLTDGVEDSALPAFKTQTNDGRSQPVVLAIGTAQGGPLRSATGGFVEDDAGQRRFARLDPAALKRLRDDAGVAVATLTPDSDDDVIWVARHIQSHLAQRQSAEHTRWKDAGWWLTMPIALLGVLWFRKGWTVRWIAALWLGLALSAPQQPTYAAGPGADVPAAAPVRPWRFADLWLTHDQQGRWAYEHGDFATAAARFDDPMWRGIALYRAGRYREAVQSFVRVDSPESDFNQGNALARQGEFKSAAERYRQALRRRPHWPAAAANLALVQKLIPPEPPKPDDKDQAEDPDLKPDQIVFDNSKGAAGKKPVQVAAEQAAEMWMRAIQTTPTDLLARRFALQQDQASAKKGQP